MAFDEQTVERGLVIACANGCDSDVAMYLYTKGAKNTNRGLVHACNSQNVEVADFMLHMGADPLPLIEIGELTEDNAIYDTLEGCSYFNI
jgi:hypothetical protein